MEDVALYYPYVTPPESWIKSSLFLVDRVTSIVPRDRTYPLESDFRWMRDEGIWEPCYADDVGSLGPNYVLDVEDVLLQYADRPVYRPVGAPAGPPFVRVYLGKMGWQVEQALADLGLAEGNHDWSLRVHEEVGAALLAVTAKHVAAASNRRLDTRMVTSTDVALCRAHAYDPVERTVDRQRCTEVLLDGLIPTPGPGTSLIDVIEFRTRHRSELQRLRRELSAFVDAIGDSSDPEDLLSRSRRELAAACLDLEQAAYSRRLRLVGGSVAVLATGLGANYGLTTDQLNLLFQGIGAGAGLHAIQHMVRRAPRFGDGDPLDYLVRARRQFG